MSPWSAGVCPLSRSKHVDLPAPFETTESRHIAGGDIGQDLAIQSDTGLFQTVHEGRIVQPELLYSGGYACDPEAAEFPLFIAPITIGILHTLVNGFYGCTVQPRTAAVIPSGFIEHLFVASVGGNIILSTWHLINTPVGLY